MGPLDGKKKILPITVVTRGNSGIEPETHPKLYIEGDMYVHEAARSQPERMIIPLDQFP